MQLSAIYNVQPRRFAAGVRSRVNICSVVWFYNLAIGVRIASSTLRPHTHELRFQFKTQPLAAVAVCFWH